MDSAEGALKLNVYTNRTSTLTVSVSWRLLSSVVPSVKGPDSTFFRLSLTSTNRSSTSTLQCSASRHASSFCFKQASNEACCLGSEDSTQLSVTQISVKPCNRRSNVPQEVQVYLGRHWAPLWFPSSPSSGVPDCSSPPPSLSLNGRAHRCSAACLPLCGSFPVSLRLRQETLGIKMIWNFVHFSSCTSNTISNIYPDICPRVQRETKKIHSLLKTSWFL